MTKNDIDKNEAKAKYTCYMVFKKSFMSSLIAYLTRYTEFFSHRKGVLI